MVRWGIPMAVLALAFVLGCNTKPGAAEGRAEMEKRLDRDCGYKLTKFEQKDGLMSDEGGVKRYTMDFAAEIVAEKGCCRLSGFQGGGLVAPDDPRCQPHVLFGAPKTLPPGGMVKRTGKIRFTKKDSGWTVQDVGMFTSGVEYHDEWQTAGVASGSPPSSARGTASAPTVTVATVAAPPASVPAPPAGSTAPSGPPESLRSSVKVIRASSSMSGSENHPPEHAFDGDPKTAWTESVDGPGKGEWIEVEFANEVTLDVVEMSTGFDYVSPKYGDLFAVNAHVKRVRLELGGGEPIEKDVDSTERKTRIDVGGRRTSRLRIVIADVYRGTKWQDLSLSEVALLGRR